MKIPSYVLIGMLAGVLISYFVIDSLFVLVATCFAILCFLAVSYLTK